jgi:PAS domain-containing protein/HPt (histidine-containing phosphotransfer) domain-containing protein
VSAADPHDGAGAADADALVELARLAAWIAGAPAAAIVRRDGDRRVVAAQVGFGGADGAVGDHLAVHAFDALGGSPFGEGGAPRGLDGLEAWTWAAVSISDFDGAALGTLVVAGPLPLALSAGHRGALRTVAAQVAARVRLAAVEAVERERTERLAELQGLRDIVHHVQVGLHVYHLEDPADDRTLRFVACNPAAERLLGLPAAITIGRTLDENFPAARGLGLANAFAEVARTGEPWSADHLIYADDRLLSAVYFVKVLRLHGNHVGVLFEDVTDRRSRVAPVAPATSVPAARAPDSPVVPAGTEDPFADLRTAYAATLPGQVTELVELLQRAPASPEARTEALWRAHRLHGTAGTYGFAEVSKAAAAVEAALRHPDGLGAPEWEGSIGRLRSALP